MDFVIILFMATLFGKPVGEVIKRPGALTAKAKKSGKSITEYCSMEGHDTRTKKQCVLAKTLKGFKK